MSVASASGTDRRRPRRLARGRTSRHLRLVARHRVRVVRLLSLRHAGAVLRGAVLPAGQRDRGAAVGLRHLRGRLPGAPVRRAGVRPHRRPGRPQVHLPGHHPGHGRLDLRGRPAADLRGGRLAGADPAGDAAPAAGPGARRRIRRRGDLRRRARADADERGYAHELDPDHGDARLLPVAASSSALCRVAAWTPRRSPTGAGAFRSWSR